MSAPYAVPKRDRRQSDRDVRLIQQAIRNVEASRRRLRWHCRVLRGLLGQMTPAMEGLDREGTPRG